MAQKLKGVNLGGWLVLERWIAPSLFKGLKVRDETGFCLELRESKLKKLQKHRRKFITEEDFQWIAHHGLNAVRIPVPYWIFGDVEPYIGAVEELDWAMAMAQKHDWKVLIDLHTAPGSQNGWDHSGLAGDINWHKNHQNIGQTIQVIVQLAKRYGGQPNLAGIELLNEPHWGVPKESLLKYYERAYQAARRYCADDVAIIISDNFQPLIWHAELTDERHKNVPLDLHLYQCFSQEDKRLDISSHLAKTEGEWADLIKLIQQRRPVIVGEWSLGLDPRTFKSTSDQEKTDAIKAYGCSQLKVFNQADGWFFWTYKTEDKGGWNFRHLVETGVLPEKF